MACVIMRNTETGPTFASSSMYCLTTRSSCAERESLLGGAKSEIGHAVSPQKLLLLHEFCFSSISPLKIDVQN